MNKKIIFVGYAISETETKNASGVSVAGNKMQLNILKELCRYDDMQVLPITVYPCASYPKDTHLIYKTKKECLWDGYFTERVGFINLPVIKQLCQIEHVYKIIRNILKKYPDAEIFSFNMFPQTGNALRMLKRRQNVKVSAILADLPIDIKKDRKVISDALMKLFYRQATDNIKILDQAIVLNRFAAKKYLQKQKYIVVEGGICKQEYDRNAILKSRYDEKKRMIVFSGALTEYNGIKNVIQAMEQVQEDVILRLYGDGPMKKFVKEMADKSAKIECMGTVSNREMIEIQREAYLLINPRPVNEPISKVTFPSKIFEYLASGTVVLTTKLNGFTEEYYDKMLFFEREEPKSMAAKIDECMRMSPARMEQMAKKAFYFVTQEKSWEVQGKKIHDFLM